MLAFGLDNALIKKTREKNLKYILTNIANVWDYIRLSKITLRVWLSRSSIGQKD